MYEPSRMISSFYVSGFQRYDGADVLGKLKVGQKLKMVGEPDNPYDPNAIELYYKGAKLGYVPRDDNGMPGMLLYFGHGNVLEARIQQVDPKRSPWHQVRVGLYLADNRKK